MKLPDLKNDRKILTIALVLFLAVAAVLSALGVSIWQKSVLDDRQNNALETEQGSFQEAPAELQNDLNQQQESSLSPTIPDTTLTTVNSHLSNTKYGWGLMPNDQHVQPEMPKEISDRLSKYGAYWVGNPEEKVIYLTFDNGYENGYTEKILDALKANEVKAAFFVTGHYLNGQPELIKRMLNEGHIVGNHTDTHPSLPDISDEQVISEIQKLALDYANITGQNGMTYLRPPKGEYSERTLAVTKELGYHNVFWSLALQDWVPLPGGPQELYQTVMERLHNGAIILLHAVSNDGAESMDRLLKDIKGQGYTFKTLDELVKKE